MKIIEKICDDILALFSAAGTVLQLNEISKRLGISTVDEEYLFLREALDLLIEQNVLEKSARRRYTLSNSAPGAGIEGILEIKGDSAFVITNNPEFPKINVKQRNLNTALSGDKVEVRLMAIKKEKKPRGEIVEIIERNMTTFIGTVDFDGHFFFFVPDDPIIYVDFLIPHSKLNGARAGDKAEAAFFSWENAAKSPQCEIVSIIGRAGEPESEFNSIIKEFDLPMAFPDEVISESKNIHAPRDKDYSDRLDLRNETIVTIDPFDARDFDDALSLKVLENGNWYLGVHIADVSAYVPENSALDLEARMRGTSVYLVDRVIPMLPEKLSNDVCSLRPNEPRFAFSVFMEISPRGAVKDYLIKESIINSARRFTYDEVQEIIETGEGDHKDLITSLHLVADTLLKKRYRQGGIEFSTTEYKFVLDEDKYPVEVRAKRTTPATSLVEECMLLANQTVAQHIKTVSKKHKQSKTLPYLYRVHDEPDQKLLSGTLEFISTFGPKIKAKVITSKEINNLLKDVANLPEKAIVHQLLIRSMPKAIYTDTNIGHFGLGFKDYTHFTSPIRRYPDLIIHRMIKEYAKDSIDPQRIKFLRMLMHDVGISSTGKERSAMEAERASNKLAFAMMADTRVGEEFYGTITGVTSFGLFVMLDDFYGEGLLHMRDMRDDYYYFDEKNFRIIGKRKRKVYGFGKRIRVKIIKVNVDKRNIDLSYIGEVIEENAG